MKLCNKCIAVKCFDINIDFHKYVNIVMNVYVHTVKNNI